MDAQTPGPETKHLPLGRGLFVIVDVADLPLIDGPPRWIAIPAGKSTGGFYAKRNQGGRTMYMHRLLTGAAKGQVVDHINGDGLDNRRANLRLGTLSHNAANRHYVNPSGFRGVHKTKSGAWIARIGWRRECFHLGTFSSAESAAAAYDQAARRLHSDFAITNFNVSQP